MEATGDHHIMDGLCLGPHAITHLLQEAIVIPDLTLRLLDEAGMNHCLLPLTEVGAVQYLQMLAGKVEGAPQLKDHFLIHLKKEGQM